MNHNTVQILLEIQLDFFFFQILTHIFLLFFEIMTYIFLLSDILISLVLFL